VSYKPIRVLLQTTIASNEDDWSIARFGLLRDQLAGQRANGTMRDGAPLFDVVARDRALPAGQDDPVLVSLDKSDFDELWLFAVDTGEGLTRNEQAAISRFYERGGGLLITRDHMDLGCSVSEISGPGRAHHFHTRNPDSRPEHCMDDDTYTSSIHWPNYHSGANGDCQQVRPMVPNHPLLRDATAADGQLHYLPAHPHEGAVDAPTDDASAAVIAVGRSKVSGRLFNLIVAFESGPEGRPGRGIAESSFHHFCDYNWDTSYGAPSFVTEPPGSGMRQEPDARRAVENYVQNVGLWLAGR
jgi:hypothetical protein